MDVKQSQIPKAFAPDLDLNSVGITHSYGEVKAWREAYEQRRNKREESERNKENLELSALTADKIDNLLRRAMFATGNRDVQLALRRLERTLNRAENA
ncbi:hypothetical protein AB4876_02600 [Zhongshania guokunii]|uniref:Uncharacterized protein n=1 Tax=Zhongshania guokunii TaxID=641783 RepID=A0ABV3U2A0_9GAMM